MKTVKVGLLGLGTVGGGVYKLLERQKEEMADKTGAHVEIAGILVHNLDKKREGVDETLLTDRWEDLLGNEEIEIIIEVMGGIEPARTMIGEALRAGKNVVTANKDLLAAHGEELTPPCGVFAIDPRNHEVDRSVVVLFHSRIIGSTDCSPGCRHGRCAPPP